MMSDLTFLPDMDTYPFTHDADLNDLMSPYKHDFTLNPITQQMPMNIPPLSPESDAGSFAESVMSSNSSQQQQQRSDEYTTEEPLTPLPQDYFINMAQLQAQQQQAQQQPQITVPPQQSTQQQQSTKPVILHTTPPTSPNEVKPTVSSKPEKSVKKQRKSKIIKPEPESPLEEDTDMVIDPNLPPDMIRELLQEQNLKKKRLARKAELARMSRKRKKTRMGDLELECERLHAEIDRLRKMRRLDMEEMENKQQQAVAAATATVTQQQQQMTQQDGKFYFDSKQWIDVSDHQKTVNDAIQAMADAARTTRGQEDTVYMNNLHETFVSHFNHQLIASEGHIAALENHIQPCMPLQFLQWVMSQPDKFIQDTTGLWNSLFQAEIGVTSDQMKEIMALRTTVKKQRKVGADVEKAYKKLSHSLRRQMLQCNENLTKLRSILTPLQLAKYFDWVNRFGHVCVKINL